MWSNKLLKGCQSSMVLRMKSPCDANLDRVPVSYSRKRVCAIQHKHQVEVIINVTHMLCQISGVYSSVKRKGPETMRSPITSWCSLATSILCRMNAIFPHLHLLIPRHKAATSKRQRKTDLNAMQESDVHITHAPT